MEVFSGQGERPAETSRLRVASVNVGTIFFFFGCLFRQVEILQ